MGHSRFVGLAKRTLVDDILVCLEQLLSWAGRLEEPAADASRDVADDVYSQVRLTRVGSPSRHVPMTFAKAHGCLVCRKLITTGCGHPECGALHKRTAGSVGTTQLDQHDRNLLSSASSTRLTLASLKCLTRQLGSANQRKPCAASVPVVRPVMMKVGTTKSDCWSVRWLIACLEV